MSCYISMTTHTHPTTAHRHRLQPRGAAGECGQTTISIHIIDIHIVIYNHMYIYIYIYLHVYETCMH